MSECAEGECSVRGDAEAIRCKSFGALGNVLTATSDALDNVREKARRTHTRISILYRARHFERVDSRNVAPRQTRGHSISVLCSRLAWGHHALLYIVRTHVLVRKCGVVCIETLAAPGRVVSR